MHELLARKQAILAERDALWRPSRWEPGNTTAFGNHMRFKKLSKELYRINQAIKTIGAI